MKLEIALLILRRLYKPYNLSAVDEPNEIEFLNLGWQEIAKRTKVLQSCIIVSMEANNDLYEIDEQALNFLELNDVDITGIGKVNVLAHNLVSRNDTDALLETGTPEFATMERRGEKIALRLRPTPDTSVTDGISVYITKNCPRIIKLDDEPELPPTYHFTGILYAIYLMTGDDRKLRDFNESINELNTDYPETKVYQKRSQI
jgi:hypothetical protein